MEATIFYQGVELLLYGMGTVIVFLVLLICAMRFMSWMIFRFLPEPENSDDTSIVTSKVDDKVIAAIGVAISQFRTRKRNHRSS